MEKHNAKPWGQNCWVEAYLYHFKVKLLCTWGVLVWLKEEMWKIASGYVVMAMSKDECIAGLSQQVCIHVLCLWWTTSLEVSQSGLCFWRWVYLFGKLQNIIW